MDRNMLEEDFRFVIDTIKSVHPLGLTKLPDDFNEYADNYANKCNDVEELIASLSRLTALLQDGHTNIEVEYLSNNLCLNLPCVWLNDGLYATEDYRGILKGDKIVGIGDYTIDEVLDKLSLIIPHENHYLVKVRSTTYPFYNYHLFSKLVLQTIGALMGSNVKLIVSRDDRMLEINLSLENYNGFLDFKDNDKFLNFWIEKNVAIFKLDECKYNKEYIEGLHEFFKLVSDKKIKNIIIDLRENMGGGAKVATEFFKYLSIDNYYFYGVKVRNGSEESLINSEQNLIKNKKVESVEPYSGKIICLVSNKTFSSARIFAVELKDNEIATILGQPTGGKPCSYGNPLRYRTPNYKIKFRVSSRTFTRPSESGKEDISLFPDVAVFPIIKEIISGEDIVLSKAVMLCS
jgi:hypothetical protein